MIATVEDHQIAYQLVNWKPNSTAPVLVFLHEGLGSIAQWRGFPEKICSSLNMSGLVYDRVGYGSSSSMLKDRDLDYMHIEAKTILPALLRQLLNSNQPIVLIGHSDGASIALIFASNYHCSAIVSMAAHTMVEDISLEGIRAATDQFKSNPKFNAGLMKFHGDKTERLFYAWSDTWLSSKFRHWNIESEIKSITCPLLALQGELDSYGTTQQLDSISVNASGKVETLIIPNAGHSPHLDQPELVESAVESFVLQNCR